MFPALVRVYEAAECQTQVELAEFLGIKQSSISNAQRRKSIPASWLLALLQQKGINPEWIKTGRGPKTIFDLGKGAETRTIKDSSELELIGELVQRALRME